MVEIEYYSNRINELEKRKEELLGKLVTTKLSLKGVDKEIECCKEAIENLVPKPIDETLKMTDKDKRIINLSKSNERLSFENKKLNKKLFKLKQELEEVCLKNEELKNNLVSLKSEMGFDVIVHKDFGRTNIFNKLVGD